MLQHKSEVGVVYHAKGLVSPVSSSPSGVYCSEIFSCSGVCFLVRMRQSLADLVRARSVVSRAPSTASNPVICLVFFVLMTRRGRLLFAHAPSAIRALFSKLLYIDIYVFDETTRVESRIWCCAYAVLLEVFFFLLLRIVVNGGR